MAASRQNSVGKLFFTDDVKAQLHTALDSMLEVHDERIRRAVETAEDKKLKVNVVLLLDCSESSPRINVDLRFTPETVTDSRTIMVTDGNQGEFTIMTPAQMEAEAAKLKAEKAKKSAEDRASGDAEPADPAEPGEEAPEKKGRKKRNG